MEILLLVTKRKKTIDLHGGSVGYFIVKQATKCLQFSLDEISCGDMRFTCFLNFTLGVIYFTVPKYD